MKKLIILFLFGTILTMSGCDLFEDAGDVTFNRVLTANINVNAGAADQNIADVLLIDAENDAEVQKYADKIKEFKVNSITYKITNYNGPSPCQFTNGSMRFSQSATNAGNVVASVASLDLSTAVGQDKDLGAASSVTTQIENFLKNDRKVYIHVAGNLSQVPVSFTLQVSFDVSVTANALK